MAEWLFGPENLSRLFRNGPLVKKIILGPTERRAGNVTFLKKKAELILKKLLKLRYLRGNISIDGKFGWNPKTRSSRKDTKYFCRPPWTASYFCPDTPTFGYLFVVNYQAPLR